MLKTDYVNDQLDMDINPNRVFRITDTTSGDVTTVTIEDISVYTTEGDNFGANDINNTNEEVNNISSNLTELEGEVNSKGIKLLWSNPSIDSAFNPQTVPLNLSAYNYVGIVCRDNYQSAYYSSMNIFKVDIGKSLKTSGTGVWSRLITSINNEGITFGNASNGTTDDNAWAIPYQIYGISVRSLD